MSELLRDTLQDLAIVILLLAALVALGGYYLYKYSFFIKGSSPPPPKPPDPISLTLLAYLKDPTTSLAQLTQSVALFVSSFEQDPISIEECALILQAAIKHPNIKGSLILQLEKCFKDHFKEDRQLFEFLVMDGIKNR